MKSIVLPFIIIAVSLTLMGCEERPKQEFVQWVVRDAWDPVCSPSAAVEKFVVKNAGWENRDSRIWRMDVDATFKTIKDCFEPKPQLAGLEGAAAEKLKELPPTMRKAAFKSFSFSKKGFAIVKCKDSAQKEGWANPRTPERCWTGPKLFDETVGVKLAPKHKTVVVKPQGSGATPPRPEGSQ